MVESCGEKLLLPQQLLKLRSRESNFPAPFDTSGGTWHCLGVTYSIFLLTDGSKQSSFPLLPLLLSHTHTWPLRQEPFWTWQQLTVRFPFYHKVPPTLMRFLSLVQKSASQQETGTHLHCSSALKGLEISLHWSLTETWLGLFTQGLQKEASGGDLQLHNCKLVSSSPPQATWHTNGEEKQLISVFSWLSLTCPLHTEQRLHNYSHPLSSPHLLRSFVITASKSITSILKCHLHCDGITLFMCWGNRQRRSGSGSQNINTLNLTEHLWAIPPPLEDYLNCSLQGSLRGTEHLRACSFGEGY